VTPAPVENAHRLAGQFCSAGRGIARRCR